MQPQCKGGATKAGRPSSLRYCTKEAQFSFARWMSTASHSGLVPRYSTLRLAKLQPSAKLKTWDSRRSGLDVSIRMSQQQAYCSSFPARVAPFKGYSQRSILGALVFQLEVRDFAGEAPQTETACRPKSLATELDELAQCLCAVLLSLRQGNRACNLRWSFAHSWCRHELCQAKLDFG